MTDPVTTETFKKLCSQWADIISRGENGIQIWSPLEGIHRRVRQFLADETLQNKLFDNAKPKLLFVDANDLTDFSFEEFEKQVMSELVKHSENISLDAYLKFNSERLAIFFSGFDTALKNDNIDTLKHISGLLEKHSNCSIILLVEFNILPTSILPLLGLKSTFFQNISYFPMYTFEDSIQFFAYLEEKWHCTLDKTKTKILAQKIGGQYWLIKEAARILRANPTYSTEEILNATTLLHKGLTLFTLLNKQDQKSVFDMLIDKPSNEISDYLLQTGLITKNNLGLSYWYHIKNTLCKFYLKPEDQNRVSDFDVYFTSTERDVFELLLDGKSIVSRELIANTLWQTNWQEKYSDWAIDQLIHRIRKKLINAKTPYRIITKKNEGFILLKK